MEQNNGHDSPSRIERLEKIVEVLANVQADMQQDHQILLRAQIVMTDEMTKLAAAQVRMAAAQARMDDALTALMGTVDEIIRSKYR